MKKVLIVSVVIFIAAVVGIGGVAVSYNKKFNDEMMQVVKSEEARKVYERVILSIDPKAFTKEGRIHSYKIDESSVEHNPMGGIMLDVILNDDKSLVIEYTLNNWSGKLSSKLVVFSVKLDELDEEINNE